MPNNVRKHSGNSSPLHNRLYLIGMRTSKHYVECDICKEQLDNYGPHYAKEHRKLYPDHKSYSIRVTQRIPTGQDIALV
jgi:hypothetical protein